MKKIMMGLSGALLLGVVACNQATNAPLQKCEIGSEYASKVDSVLKLMTLEEKIGQMNQYTGGNATGPEIADNTKGEQIVAGKVGSMLNVIGAKNTREVQDLAMQSRLKIPLLFGLDVIHGFRTIYPIPLGEAASFDLDLIKRTAAGAAEEASSEGIHWTFAPMVDIARDARWGRVMEGAGEDPWYGSKVAAARVHGFQGDDLYATNTILACAKHFAAYGAAIAGKDYNTVDISELTLNEVYLAPFKAAKDAGVATFMNSFNEINGIPATAHTGIQRDLLKGSWGFNGITVSDWNSVGEMVNHGYVKNLKEAAYKAVLGGCDMDMESRAYTANLKELVDSGVVDIAYIDDAVRRILLKKFELGLFEDPYRYCDEEREKSTVLSDKMHQLSREAGAKSIVLLKNENQALPLSANVNKIAVVGALANSKSDMIGFWANEGNINAVVTVLEGIQNKFPNAKISYSEGYDLNSFELKNLAQAKQAAAAADVVIVAVGERSFFSGEGNSRGDINVNANQQQLVQELKKSGKKVIVLLMGGRPMIFNEMTPSSDAILLTWWLGTEAGNAIADVLTGEYNPSGKLPMTFPAHIGQLPIYYNTKNTGRPGTKGQSYSSCYQDIEVSPAYPFGYGLSYSSFEISEPKTNAESYKLGEDVKISVTVKNTGIYKGKETIQLYIRDMVASAIQPIKELRGFQQIELNPGEEKNIEFTLNNNDLSFLNTQLQRITEPGTFKIMVGSNSRDLKETSIEVVE